MKAKGRKREIGLTAREKTTARISHAARDVIRQEAKIDGREIHRFLEDVIEQGIKVIRQQRGDRSSDVLETETQ